MPGLSSSVLPQTAHLWWVRFTGRMVFTLKSCLRFTSFGLYFLKSFVIRKKMMKLARDRKMAIRWGKLPYTNPNTRKKASNSASHFAFMGMTKNR